jgi:hypothetical protein
VRGQSVCMQWCTTMGCINHGGWVKGCPQLNAGQGCCLCTVAKRTATQQGFARLGLIAGHVCSIRTLGVFGPMQVSLIPPPEQRPHKALPVVGGEHDVIPVTKHEATGTSRSSVSRGGDGPACVANA